ncbi:MAG: hypothetical protein ACYDEJ_11145 [Desulfitobacteriaceae bacterium]
MLIKLINYEIIKKWKASRYFLFGYVVLQAVLLMLTRVFFWNDMMPNISVHNNWDQGTFSFVCTIALYFVLVAILSIYPFIESIYRYERDLSGKQAVLELMIPIISWKKIVSKLITTICATSVCLLLAAFTIIAFVLITGNFDKSMVDMLLNNIKYAMHFPMKIIVVSLFVIFNLVSLYMIFFFCTAFSKAFSHKKKVAVPIGIGVFIILVAVFGYLGMQIEKIPIYTYSILGMNYSISSTIYDILVFILLLLGTSWLMEKRIEH